MDSLPAGQIGFRVEGCGPPIVLLHSSMSSKSQWRELIDSLRDRYRLIAIDLLGYGETAMPSSCEGYGLHDEVRLVESVLARELRAGERFHLIGHSFGGVVALQLAQTQPHRLRSLSLFEPIAFNLLPARDPDLAMIEAAWNQIDGRWLIGDAHGAARSFVDYWSGAGAFAELRESRRALLSTQVAKLLLELRAVAGEPRNAAAYRRIAVPTCLVAGFASPEPAQRLMSMFADLLPHASCFEVAAGHMAPITHPELVNPILEKFIDAVDAAANSQVIPENWDRPLAIPQFAEMTSVVLGRGWSRAIAMGLSGALLAVLPLFALQSAGQRHFGISPDVTYPLGEGAWHELPPGLPSGGTYAVISGDPLTAGPFVMRVRWPPGYTLPPYRRRKEEEVIVLAGAITVGTSGEPGVASARTLTSGSYVLLSANEIHFAHTENGAIVQIVGTGPFEIEYPT